MKSPRAHDREEWVCVLKEAKILRRLQELIDTWASLLVDFVVG
jgi:hypothetical protein